MCPVSGVTRPAGRLIAHKVTKEGPDILVDGQRVFVAIDADKMWVTVGCTRITTAALKKLNEIVGNVAGTEIVLQDGSFGLG